ncbi:MAG: hypothetical protein ACLFUF_00445 [Opitutales bacterium]
MADWLDGLRAQRKLVQEHLDWLDRRIEEAERTEPAGRPLSTARRSGEDVTADSIEESASADKETGTATNEDSAAASSHERSPGLSDTEEAVFASKANLEVRRLQIGCFLIFLGATAIFLLLLFGLPYLFYP